ncbi:protein of unknown function [Microbulbifer donghaiensis]|uniref:DUF4845 domain-containing protein n=1 Tax=Microbulbifer donghaiensis TaxID=494016 RepID=A0A1M4WM90_9GAMM|nr:DUF4845 domain-containing protein [Microbulbifer donghaiensis]SHE82421.1 protein of unknown function [Microbulbifer donghaiensis]
MSGNIRSSLRGQRGMSYWSLIFYISGFALIILFASKLAPGYVDAMHVENGLKDLAEKGNIRDMNRGEIVRDLQTYFMLNNVRGEPTKSVQVIRGAEGMLVSIDYELRQPLIHNIDVVMKFNKQLNTAKPELCCEPLVDLEQYRKRD